MVAQLRVGRPIKRTEVELAIETAERNVSFFGLNYMLFWCAAIREHKLKTKSGKYITSSIFKDTCSILPGKTAVTLHVDQMRISNPNLVTGSACVVDQLLSTSHVEVAALLSPHHFFSPLSSPNSSSSSSAHSLTRPRAYVSHASPTVRWGLAANHQCCYWRQCCCRCCFHHQ